MEFKGINHLALVCRDMAETVRFYTQVLGMPLTKTIELPGGGQHFFFDCGNGDSLAFFWWADGPPAAPGVASADSFPKGAKSAVGSMNHVAFAVPEEKLELYMRQLQAAGVPLVPMVVNHDDSEQGVAAAVHEGVFVRSVYFYDPNGIMLELAAWTRPLHAGDVRHAPAAAAPARVLEPAA